MHMPPVSRRGTKTDLRAWKKNQDLSREFLTGVSLHAHTHHSQESLAHLPRYITQIPVVGSLFDQSVQEHQERIGGRVDFARGWWHPPVSPRAVFDSEAAQISKLGLTPIVSVTDHDSLTAGFELQRTFSPRCSPLSFEWTAPYGAGFVHLGVHNLPPASAGRWFDRLSAFTDAPGREPIVDILTDLTSTDDVLVILNHPIWDLADEGDAAHQRMLVSFLAECGDLIHALELNGYRSWKENLDVVALARETGHPLISGGDRHACAPNALINLSHASSFAGFVHEIKAGISTVMTMPEYREHVIGRTIASVADVVTSYRQYPEGWRHWTDRVSCQTTDGLTPLSHHWPTGGPLWLRSVMSTVRLLAWQPLRKPLARVLEWRDRKTGTPTSVAWPPRSVVTAAGELSR
jgi:hypothetical protein